MAGINPTTGKFDPYYNSPTNYFTQKSQTPYTTIEVKPGVFENIQTAWTNPGGSWGTPVAQAPAPTTAPADTKQKDAPTEDPYTKWLREEQANIERKRTMNAIAVLGAQLESLGLGSLSGKITSWVQDGYDGDAVQALIRQTPEYAARFPAMKALQAKGQSISEGEYIAYEQTMASYEKLFGLPGGMLTDKDRITKMLVKGVSAREVEERVTKASAAMYKLPEEFRKTMRDYYGVDSGGLTGYFLDPEIAAPLLERQFVTAKIGTEASTQGLSVGRGMSEYLYEQGIDEQQARKGFGSVAAASSLTSGRGDTVTQDDLIKGSFDLDPEAKRNIARAAGSRVARFEGGGAFATGQSGVSGIGSASS